MISRRLTKIQKDEILEAYQAGENTHKLAEKYSCSSNTINRTVKTLLSDDEYKLLKKHRLKSSNKNLDPIRVESSDGNHEDFDQPNAFISPKTKVNEEEDSIKINHDFKNYDFEKIPFLPTEDIPLFEDRNSEKSDIKKTNKNTDNNFEEIVPLISNFDFEQKQLDYEIHNQDSLPESVYMIVDKKVELEVKVI